MKVILSILFLFLFLDLTFGLILREMHRHTPGDDDPLREVYYSSKNYEVIFVGTSRTKFNIDTPYFKKLTNLTSYNLGCKNCNIEHQSFMLQEYIQKNKIPKFIFMELGPWTISQNGFFKKHLFAPYVGQSERVRHLLYPSTSAKLLSYLSCLSFNRLLFPTVWRFFLQPAKETLGFEYLQNIYIPNDSDHQSKFRVVNDRVKSVMKTLKYLESLGSQVFIFTPPYYAWERESEKFKNYWSKFLMTKELRGKVFNHLQDPRFIKDSRFFFDEGHLNGKGARAYTKILLGEVKTKYREK